MKRRIVGYHTDEENHWVADLECGHGQHVRHNPPLSERPWVLSREGRHSRLGVELNCVRCNSFELPENLVLYRRTPVYAGNDISSGLLNFHTTENPVWGKIIVNTGALTYTVLFEGITSRKLTPGHPGIIVPGVEHKISPKTGSTFFIEYYRSRSIA